jgi:hypothetical protein
VAVLGRQHGGANRLRRRHSESQEEATRQRARGLHAGRRAARAAASERDIELAGQDSEGGRADGEPVATGEDEQDGAPPNRAAALCPPPLQPPSLPAAAAPRPTRVRAPPRPPQVARALEKLAALPTAAERAAYAEEYTSPQKGGARESATTVLTLSESTYVKSACDYALEGGFVLDKQLVLMLMNAVLADEAAPGEAPRTSTPTTCASGCGQGRALGAQNVADRPRGARSRRRTSCASSGSAGTRTSGSSTSAPPNVIAATLRASRWCASCVGPRGRKITPLLGPERGPSGEAPTSLPSPARPPACALIALHSRKCQSLVDNYESIKHSLGSQFRPPHKCQSLVDNYMNQ